VALKYAVRVNGLTGLVITKLDALGGLGPLGVAVRYTGPEDVVFEEFPYHQTMVHKARADVEILPGWDDDIGGARTLADLPKNARDYLDFVERHLGVPIVLVGVGPGRDQIVRTGGGGASRYLPPPPPAQKAA
jgi:adenylosuccinate synthase